MALLNTAYVLAGWGKHVLMVDMDLEAPGVSGFLHRHKELAPTEVERPLDILTLLGEVIAAAKAGTPAKQIARDLPPLANYIRSVSPEKLAPLAPKLGSLGRLDIVAADMDRDWCRRLAELGLQGIAQDRLIEISSALHGYFKAHRFPHRPHGLEDFEAMEDTPYDYILIDSRTGITEVGGLCVGPLADRLIVLSSLNDQNIEGTLTFLKEAGIKPQRRNKKSKAWDDADMPADSEIPSLGPKPTLVVASPVPNGEIQFKRQRLQELERRLGAKPMRLSYHPQMALMEGVFVRDYEDEYLAGEYLELANALTMQVGDHPDQLSAKSFAFQMGDKTPMEAVNLALRLASHRSDTGPPILRSLAGTFNATNDTEFRAVRRLHALMAGVPRFRDAALYNWGNALSDQATTKQGAEADRLFAEAGAKYEAALKIKPDKHEAFNNWGNALFDQAKTKQGGEADRLFAEAGAKYEAALKIKPDKHEAFNNWGNALFDQAKTKQGGEADRLFAEAGAK
jgi:tetratricopeptide (TPR) repeat protein